MSLLKKALPPIVGLVGLWLGVKYLLPVALPFLAGLALAFAAEPFVCRISGKLPRGVSAGIGVSVTMVLVAAVVYFVGAVAVRQLKKLTTVLPDLENTAMQATQVAEDFFINLSQRMPESLQPALQRTVLDFFDDGTMLFRQLTQQVPGFIGTTITRVGDGAIAAGTGILSAFLISSRLPQLKKTVRAYLPQSWHTKVKPTLDRVKRGLGGWLKAQLKLTGVTFCILTVGFAVLRIPYAPAWGALIALVDAVPVLGTGTVLIPWAIICFFRKNVLQGVGLLCIYGGTFLTRAVLEPRLVGKHLGLDPLLTLGAMYMGYCFWGIWGMLLAPILASALVSAFDKGETL